MTPPPSVTQRQDLLNLIENILRYPEKYGDRSFSDKVYSSKNGMVLITSLKSVVTDLDHVPAEYIQYCIPLDIKTRFRMSADGKMVGLFDHYSNEETDSHGFIKQLDDGEAITEMIISTPTSQKTSIKRTPSIFTRLSQQEAVMPTVFQDGKFFMDTEHNEAVDPIQGSTDFIYHLVKMDPLGLRHPIDPFFVPNSCFNCGSTHHKIGDCPIPINKERVERNKRNISQNSRMGRLHVEMELQNRVSGIAPGVLSDRLKDALEMTSADDIPPYYRNMRWFGYPPGYMGTEEDKLQYGATLTLEDWRRSTTYTLKFYNDDMTEMDHTSEGQKMLQNDKSQQLAKQLVHYPGLELLDTTQLDRHIATVKYQAPPPPLVLNHQLQQQQQLEQQYWSYYYYTQYLPECQQQYYYPHDEEPIYAPGTIPAQSTTSIDQSSSASATPRVENPIWSVLRERRQAKANPGNELIVDDADREDSDISDDMDISSEDER